MTKQAFSLVELSIVLVILGLLTGGILTGQSLIRAAELRSVTTQFNEFITASYIFKNKYFAIAGDMTNATAFWGVTTNNGDGDGRIEDDNGAATPENFLAWQHLALAGLIGGQYTGQVGGGGTYDAIAGQNTPSAKLSNAGWSIDFWDASSGYFGTEAYWVNYGNAMFFGAKQPNDGYWAPILTPEEAWNIDKKIDDGKPAKGRIHAYWWDDACSAADDGSNDGDDFESSYRLSDKSMQCSLIIKDAL
jgi:prepilin-type N-terminal cleavage/methylation domain-containing protein